MSEQMPPLWLLIPLVVATVVVALLWLREAIRGLFRDGGAE